MHITSMVCPGLVSEHLNLVQQVPPGALHVVLELVQVPHQTLLADHAATDIQTNSNIRVTYILRL